MASTSEQNETITYPLPGMTPDVSLNVFDQNYLVHSTVLLQHSAWFRTSIMTRLRRAEGQQSTLVPGVQHRYCERVDSDGSWSLQLCDLTQETRAFGFLLDAFYGRRFKLGTVDALDCLVRQAHYYLALPALSIPVDAGLHADLDLIAEISANACCVLQLAADIRSATLFREAYVHVIGQRGLDECHRSKMEPKLEVLAGENYFHLRALVSLATEHLLGAKMRKEARHGSGYPIYQKNERNFFGKILELADQSLDPTYLLCAKIEDSQLPWATDEVDW
ncbi:MAG: hypothetical protein M1832_005679 [Thelocarpon impressellum]|nr:MAG: hypothetical protein M1832_005679 [Thelocarpon impressellum]